VIAATAQARHSAAAQDTVVSHRGVVAPSTINDMAPSAFNDVALVAINDVAPPRMLGDINGDHRVDQTDFPGVFQVPL
jgi:hypothetical protein